MKKHSMLALLLLASCAGQKGPDLSQQPTDHGQYQADLEYCQTWATPTRHEWAMRCQATGDIVMAAQIIDYLSATDPRDKDALRQNMPNDTHYRLDMCMKAKGYKIDMPADSFSKTASR